jgi:hypothetical protein
MELNNEIEANGKVYMRRTIKINYAPINTSLEELIVKHIVPIYKKGDILYISKTLVSVCTSQVLYRFDIHVKNLAKEISRKIPLIKDVSPSVNSQAMQVAIYLVGVPRIIWAKFVSEFSSSLSEAKKKFIKHAGKVILQIGGLISDSFPDYEEFAILPPVGATELCADIRKKYGITCFIGAKNDENPLSLVACSRDMKITEEELENIFIDNPLGQKTNCTPFCIIRDSSLKEEEPPKTDEAQQIENSNF